MSEASFASLSPTLLARKGGARPAMRPQLASLGQISGEAAAANLEDLGWDDMGEGDSPREAEVVHLTPAPHNEEAEEETREIDLATASLLADPTQPAVRKQQVDLAERIAASAPEPAAAEPAANPRPRRSSRSAQDRGARTAFTLRLDAERHLKLRLACTVRNRSAQQLVTEALDALLDQMPGIDSLADQAKRT